MIRVKKVPEPEEFDQKVRKKGNGWIRKKPDNTNYPSYWSEFRPTLAEGFENRCDNKSIESAPIDSQSIVSAFAKNGIGWF